MFLPVIFKLVILLPSYPIITEFQFANFEKILYLDTINDILDKDESFELICEMRAMLDQDIDLRVNSVSRKREILVQASSENKNNKTI